MNDETRIGNMREAINTNLIEENEHLKAENEKLKAEIRDTAKKIQKSSQVVVSEVYRIENDVISLKAQLRAIKKVGEPVNALWKRNRDQLELVVRAGSDGTLIGITGSNQMLRRLAEKLDEVEDE